MTKQKILVLRAGNKNDFRSDSLAADDNYYNMIAKTHTGLEELLAGEIKAIGGDNIRVLNRAVAFSGSIKTMYRANYLCRTALRVLKVIAVRNAADGEELYQQIRKTDWSNYLSPEQTLAIDAFVSNSSINNSQYAAQKAKDAIADQFREKSGVRPSVDLINPDLRINLHLAGNECTLSLDSSGESLHKRGYRQWQGEAPVNEALAAGMILLTGWKGQCRFFDPMCGSGTLLIEAAMIARNIPAGYYRKTFGFMKWRDFDLQLWKQVKTEADKRITSSCPPIEGADINKRIISVAQHNITEAQLEKFISLRQEDLEMSNPAEPSDGIIVTNPPYGERLQKEDLPGFYRMIGDVLKKNFSGWDAWLITSDYAALKSVGLRTSRKIRLYNGPLECRFVKYEMYTGTRKSSK